MGWQGQLPGHAALRPRTGPALRAVTGSASAVPARGLQPSLALLTLALSRPLRGQFFPSFHRSFFPYRSYPFLPFLFHLWSVQTEAAFCQLVVARLRQNRLATAEGCLQ